VTVPLPALSRRERVRLLRRMQNASALDGECRQSYENASDILEEGFRSLLHTGPPLDYFIPSIRRMT
jgi:hypothetical protein